MDYDAAYHCKNNQNISLVIFNNFFTQNKKPTSPEFLNVNTDQQMLHDNIVPHELYVTGYVKKLASLTKIVNITRPNKLITMQKDATSIT